VSSRGEAGTRCPTWHTDHVPVRWIQALVGPGCMWIDDESGVEGAVNWQNMNNLDNDDDDTVITSQQDDRNSLLIDKGRARIRQAKTGEGVLLFGSTWPAGTSSSSRRRPAVHKSPDNISTFEGRVVLTMDVHLLEQPKESTLGRVWIDS
jgi:Protein of unknown function (DUF1826)